MQYPQFVPYDEYYCQPNVFNDQQYPYRCFNPHYSDYTLASSQFVPAGYSDHFHQPFEAEAQPLPAAAADSVSHAKKVSANKYAV
jgi:hypothetical protein